MDRRSLLTGVGCALLGGAAGCLDRLDAASGDADDGSNDGVDDDGSNEVDLDCEPYEGRFGVLVVGIPAAVPDDVTIIDLEETGILEYDVVEAEMEHARERRPEHEDRVEEYGREGSMEQIGSVKLGNGERYEDVEASLNEYESAEGRLGPRWYATYRGDVYGLDLGSSPIPLSLDDPTGYDRQDGVSAGIKIHAVESVPDEADVIDAVEEDLADREYLGEILAIAGCSDEIEGVPDQTGRIAWYFPPVDWAREIRETLGESRKTNFEDGDGDGWYVRYDGDVYALELGFGEA